MRSSDWPYVVLTIAVFAISGSLFYVVGKREAIRQGAIDREPLVVIPLDSESDDLRQELALRVQDLDKSRERVDELTGRIDTLEQNEARLRDEKAELAEQIAAAEILNEKQTEELDALASAKNALEASIEILERELDNRLDKIAALENQLETATAAASTEAPSSSQDLASDEEPSPSQDLALAEEPSPQDTAPTVQVIDASSLQGDRESPPAEETLASADNTGDDAEIASGLERGLIAYKAGRYEEAFATWMPLAKDGIRRAQFYVGGLYHDGQGVAPDRLEAHYWVSRARQSGYPPSEELLEKITAEMSDSELREAQARLLASTEGKLGEN
jgi:TPR repeat protein